jgi:hypothetical protein
LPVQKSKGQKICPLQNTCNNFAAAATIATIAITAIIFSWMHMPSEVLQASILHILAISITCSFISLIFLYFFPQQSLNFFPDPHGHASFGAGVFFDPQQLAIFFTSFYVFFWQ